eukprot:4789645-Pyramimonas_sp.AAC.1
MLERAPLDARDCWPLLHPTSAPRPKPAASADPRAPCRATNGARWPSLSRDRRLFFLEQPAR